MAVSECTDIVDGGDQTGDGTRELGLATKSFSLKCQGKQRPLLGWKDTGRQKPQKAETSI